MAFGVGATSFIINIILKIVPDSFCPKIGQDSVDDMRKERQKRKQEAALVN